MSLSGEQLRASAAQVNAWAIGWTEESDTGFHDHDEGEPVLA